MSESGTLKADYPASGYAPDSIWRDWAVDLQVRAHSLRELRAALLTMAYWLDEHQAHRGVVLLVDSRISRKRLEEEKRRARQVLRPNISRRIYLLSVANRHQAELNAGELELDRNDLAEFQSWIRRLIVGASRRRKPRDTIDLVLEVVLNQWMLNKGPMTTKWIMETTGFSYPPVARALKQLEPALKRHSDRRVELTYFPRHEWSRYLGAVERAGFGFRYKSPTSLARSANAMLERLWDIPCPGLALSGIHAARHYEPELDLVGSPRLDLCLHSPHGVANLEFVKTLDPALKRSGTSSDGPPALVVWPVYRDRSLFRQAPGGIPWADPVSCLLALHDARLESQAEAFLHAFTTARERGGFDD